MQFRGTSEGFGNRGIINWYARYLMLPNAHGSPERCGIVSAIKRNARKTKFSICDGASKSTTSSALKLTTVANRMARVVGCRGSDGISTVEAHYCIRYLRSFRDAPRMVLLMYSLSGSLASLWVRLDFA
jgi:hypothetical protein